MGVCGAGGGGGRVHVVGQVAAAATDQVVLLVSGQLGGRREMAAGAGGCGIAVLGSWPPGVGGRCLTAWQLQHWAAVYVWGGLLRSIVALGPRMDGVT